MLKFTYTKKPCIWTLSGRGSQYLRIISSNSDHAACHQKPESVRGQYAMLSLSLFLGG